MCYLKVPDFVVFNLSTETDEEENGETMLDDSCSVDDGDIIGGAEGNAPEFDMMDEPELEFDEVGVELSAQDGMLNFLLYTVRQTHTHAHEHTHTCTHIFLLAG